MMDKCVLKTPTNNSCTSTRSITIKGKVVNIPVYELAKFKTLSLEDECPFGSTKVETLDFKNYYHECIEYDKPAPPYDLNKSYVYGFINALAVEKCEANKGGGSCYIQRMSYNTYRFYAK
jgi:hypothetical protein